MGKLDFEPSRWETGHATGCFMEIDVSSQNNLILKYQTQKISILCDYVLVELNNRYANFQLQFDYYPQRMHTRIRVCTVRCHLSLGDSGQL